MEAAPTLRHHITAARAEVTQRRGGAGLLGLAVLGMLCATEVTWLLTGSPDAAAIVAAAEGIQLPQ